ncbi:MAG: response regulator [Phycisphaerales bacterium]
MSTETAIPMRAQSLLRSPTSPVAQSFDRLARPVGTTSVLCVDDHALVLDGLKVQFSITGRIQVVGTLPNANGLTEEIRRLRPDIVILDIEMPGADIFEIAARIQRQNPDQRFILLSAHVRDSYLSAAYRCGAWGYLSKNDDPAEIERLIIDVAKSRKGGFVMSSHVRSRCMDERNVTNWLNASPAPAAVHTVSETLTDREIEIIRLIGKGLSRGDIAKELCRSVKTVDGHQERIMKKLGIDKRTELLRFAIREGYSTV